MTSRWRRTGIDATWSCRIDVSAAVFRGCAPAGSPLERFIVLNQKWICVVRTYILAAFTSIWICPLPLMSILSSFWRRELRTKAGSVKNSWFPCGHHKGRMVIAVLEGDLMGNPCWVEGVGAISRPSGTLSYRFLSFFLFLSFFSFLRIFFNSTCTYIYLISLAKSSATL